MTGPKIYFTIPLFGGIPITQTVVSSFLVMVCLCIAGILLGRNLQKRPSRRQVLVEKGVSMLYGMVEDTMGKHNSYWTPYIGALFLSSIFGSYIGMTGNFPFRHSGSVHHRYLGTDDQLPLLGVLHQSQRRAGMAERIYRADCGHDAHESGIGDCPTHFHGVPSFR